MNIRLHQRAERVVDPAVALEAIEAGECLGDQTHAVVPSTVAGAGMARVQMALVLDLEGLGLEGVGQSPTHLFNPVCHGSTHLKGLTTDRA